ncbi:MAG: deoxyribose-phosphate aldolase [Sedimentisphaerales bacterium]|nr:deoxyribose-phosphate aldolase [Sedimentisphaerales bacterium]
MKYTCDEIAKMIDHSLLRPEMTQREIVTGCEIAKKYHVASVCCGPSSVALVRRHLAGSDVKVTTVVGFPNGYSTTETKVFEAEQAIRDGAVELDMVINIGRLLSGDFDYVENDIKAVVETAHRHKVLVKVILENYYLTPDLIEKACRLAERAGADFVKTSTGFAPGGATIEDLLRMRKTCSPKVQVKAAGGIRTLDMAVKVREIGCTRFGCTRTESIMEECRKTRRK